MYWVHHLACKCIVVILLGFQSMREFCVQYMFCNLALGFQITTSCLDVNVLQLRETTRDIDTSRQEISIYVDSSFKNIITEKHLRLPKLTTANLIFSLCDSFFARSTSLVR
ncbi:hypothetical protein M758_UG106200 [Ceratodon purpureus]|nr:hypothetical protein M758_UG106200 [Ceratodon purpureus]